MCGIAFVFIILFIEINQTDSQAETGSSDEFIDDIADGLEPIDSSGGIDVNSATNVIGVNENDATFQIVNSAVEAIGEVCDQNRPAPSAIPEVLPYENGFASSG